MAEPVCEHCKVIDPSENLLDQEASPAEVVEADIRAIESADGLLVNMWRESIGAALGVVHAHGRGKPVVVSDPNHLQNRILTFYADAVTETPLKGAKALLDLLGAESNWSVLKSGQREKPFDRHTLMATIQGACRDARRDDHDARIAALCRYHGVRVLWSADRDFSRFPGLAVINPLQRD